MLTALLPAAAARRPDRAPRSEADLLERARALAGQSLGHLASLHRMRAGDELLHAKGFAGQIVEAALGCSAGSAAAPDFADLGIELKTLPFGRNGRPAESTFVATLSSAESGALRWPTSPIRAKLARVLWVPVEGDPTQAWAQRRIGYPVIWSPTSIQEAALRDDFELIAELIAEGFRDRISARLGRYLQLRPKGRDSRDLRWSIDGDGSSVRAPGRAFYLRPSFTASIVPGRFA